MTRLRRGATGAFSAALPEKLIFIQTSKGTRYLRLTPGAQILAAAALLATAGWLVVSTASVAVDYVAADAAASPQASLQDAYQIRLAELAAERDSRAAEALSAQRRFQIAMDQIGRQQSRFLDAVEAQRELEAALQATRTRLRDAVAQRDAVSKANESLLARVNAAADSLRETASGSDLTETLEIVTEALTDAVAARDSAGAERDRLATELARTALELKVAGRRHEEMLDQVEQAVAASAAPLEALIRKVDLDVDSLIASVRPQYSGQGGPLVPLGVSTRSFPGDETVISRFDSLMIDIDRMNLLRIAIGKVPYALPVKDSYRFTSGFGTRRDPKGGGRRMHAGVDFAAPRGTKIYATADGVVKSAKSEGAYGQAIRIQHEFGFETVYAHQSKLRVVAGQRVSRGEHIGDMGSTGRVTGVHLHYEVRLNGRPLNPMTYVEAAKDVF